MNVRGLIRSGIRSIHTVGFRRTVRKGFFMIRTKRDDSRIPDDLSIDSSKINIAFCPAGGIGDICVNGNYIYKFRKMFDRGDLCIQIVHRNIENMKSIFDSEEKIIDGFCHRAIFDRHKDEFDIVIYVSRYPFIDRVDTDRIEKTRPDIYDYICRCRSFYDERIEIFSNQPFLDGEAVCAELASGRIRMQQPDFDGSLGIMEKYEFPVRIPDYDPILDENGINVPFITIHRGCDTNLSKESTKMWPERKYEEMIKELKERYPDYCLVQLGVSSDRCSHLDGIDVDLIGKTTLDQIKYLMKKSTLHVDSEGGMVHIRHAVKGGPSAVLFGPTSMAFYGYTENINISGNTCDKWCEWSTKKWFCKCPRNNSSESVCMASIEVGDVMGKISDYLDSLKNQ